MHIFVSEIVYLGYSISKDSIRPTNEYIQKTLNFKVPTNPKQLPTYFGMVQWIAKFIPDLAHETLTLNKLREKNVQWIWSNAHQTSFDNINKLIKTHKLLYHPQQNVPFTLHCDASEYDVGAALLQKQNNIVVPIEFTSKQ